MNITRIGRYEIEKELGRGAMAVVYKAVDPLIGRVVAIKTIQLEKGSAAEQEELRQRLYREAQSAGSLNHPNIVTIYDIGQEGDLAYIAMEYVEGETLQEWMSHHPIPPVEQTVAIIGQVGSGLAFAAARGIIHRDIKPGNILLKADLQAKIADFGIAKFSMSKLTTTGLIIGTPAYMSPEQAMGKDLDGRSDLFSLGIIFYEMLTGERPFSGTNPTTIIYKILHEDPASPKALNVTLHPGLDYIVRKMLAKDPDQRYQSCTAFVKDLQNHTSLGTVQAAAAAPPPRKRARGLVIAGLMAAVLGAAGYFIYTQVQPPAVQEPQPAAETPTQSIPAPQPTREPQPSAASEPAKAEEQKKEAAVVEQPPTETQAPPALPPPPPPARIRVDFSGAPYGVALYDGRRKIRDISAAAQLELPSGEHRFRLVAEDVHLNLQLDRISLGPKEEFRIIIPGLASAYIEVPNDAYNGCEITLNGARLPQPYPAQIPMLAAGSHKLVFRWAEGKYAGKEFSANFSCAAGHHYLVLGNPEAENISVQQAR